MWLILSPGSYCWFGGRRLISSFGSEGARAIGAVGFSFGSAAKLFAPLVRKALGDSVPPEADAILSNPPDLRIEGVSLVDGRAAEGVVAIPLQGIADLVKLGMASAGMPMPSGEEALFDE